MQTRAEADRQALYAAILADPADDVVRLAYADALEEDGQRERAELIRVQVELAGLLPTCPLPEKKHAEWRTADYPERCNNWPHDDCQDCVKREGLHGRESGLLVPDNFWPWFYERGESLMWAFPGTPGTSHLGRGICKLGYGGGTQRPDWYLTIRRGFVDTVECPASAWLEHGPRLIREHPLTRVKLNGREPASWFNGDIFTWGFAEGDWNEAYNHDILPTEFRDYMPGGETGYRGRSRSRDGAFDMLSVTAISWARATSRGGSVSAPSPAGG